MPIRRAALLSLALALGACESGPVPPGPVLPMDTASPGLDAKPLPQPAVETLSAVCQPADPALAAAMLAAVNAERAAAGRTPLRADARLDAAAQSHSCDMRARGQLAVAGSNGNSVLDRVRAVGFRTCDAAQNIARAGAPEALARQWRRDRIAWDNMGDQKFDALGIGAAPGGDGRLWWTLVFSRAC